MVHTSLDAALTSIASFQQEAADKGAKHRHKEGKGAKRAREPKKGKDKGKERDKDAKKAKRQRAAPKAPELSLEEQLARGREAARLTRQLRLRFPAQVRALRELLWDLDQGSLVDFGPLSGAQPALGALLTPLLHSLPLSHLTGASYTKRAGSDSLLVLLGPVLDEPLRPEELAQAQAEQARGLPGHPGAATAGGIKAEAEDAGDEEAPGPQPPVKEEEGLVGPSLQGGSRWEEGGAGSVKREPEALAEPSIEGPVPARVLTKEEALEEALGGRVLGPALPPAELLEAAAAANEQYLRDVEAEGLEELIGPAPPEALEADAAASSDERGLEVARVLRALEESPEGQAAYAVLGVAPDTPAPAIKKRFWRLSLLVHPDKCPHPAAARAFHAATAAARDLQDAGKRRALDQAIADRKLRKLAEEDIAAQERERQWRVARGTATAEDLKGPLAAAPQGRDTWMTQLPPERTAAAKPSQTAVTSFSQGSVTAPRDAGWGETPQDRLLRLSGAHTAAQQALPSTADGADAAAASAARAAVADFNAAHRPKTLVEQHQARLKAEAKAAKKARKAGAGPPGGAAAPGDDSWKGAHPWRPFDREKDLNAGSLKPATAAELLKGKGALRDRFG